MFFETGESEMPSDYALPTMAPTPREWLQRYLEDVCSPARVDCLGQMKAFAPGGSEKTAIVERSLFAVLR
jgi:hypothetical protein